LHRALVLKKVCMKVSWDNGKRNAGHPKRTNFSIDTLAMAYVTLAQETMR